MKPSALLVAPRYSYRIAAYQRAAVEAGLDLLIVSNGEHSLIDALASGIHVDFGDLPAAVERVVTALDGVVPAGVAATDDTVVELAAALAARLGLAGNPIGAARYSRRKDLARACLAAAGVAVPEHHTMRLADAAGGLPSLPFPVVVKPLSLSASRGVIRADDAPAFRRACERIAPIVAGADDPDTRVQVLVERYLPGEEIALEGLLDDGRLQVLAAFDKPEPLQGPYFEESYYVTPSRRPAGELARAAATVQAACAAYGLRHGPVHAELRLNGEGIFVLEVAARTIGGQCAMLVEFATGHALEELVLANACGRPVTVDGARRAAGVLMIPIRRGGVLRRVEGVLAAERVPGIERVELWLREGHELVPLPEGSSYLGFVFASAATPAEVERALREAHSRLEIVVAPKWDIVAA